MDGRPVSRKLGSLDTLLKLARCGCIPCPYVMVVCLDDLTLYNFTQRHICINRPEDNEIYPPLVFYSKRLSVNAAIDFLPSAMTSSISTMPSESLFSTSNKSKPKCHSFIIAICQSQFSVYPSVMTSLYPQCNPISHSRTSNKAKPKYHLHHCHVS